MPETKLNKAKQSTAEMESFSDEAVSNPEENSVLPCQSGKFCNITLQEKKITGKLEAVPCKVVMELPGNEEKESDTDSKGTVNINLGEVTGTYKIKQIETNEENAAFEFISLA
ncbi:MAG TPA: hypothetical protein ENJ08_17265 [Gammaproteobacteria bacterium]|nr:hypothetical protein [Gammaproteobacteria bacterium]